MSSSGLFLANSIWFDHRRSTTATSKTLDAVIERVKVLDPDAVKIISVVSPLAGCLVKNEGFNQFEVARILRQLQCCSRRLMREHEYIESSTIVQRLHIS